VRADPGQAPILAVQDAGSLVAALAFEPISYAQDASLAFLPPGAGELARFEVGHAIATEGALRLSLSSQLLAVSPRRDPSGAAASRVVYQGPSGPELVPQRSSVDEIQAEILAPGLYTLQDVSTITVDVERTRAALRTADGLARGAEALEVLQVTGRQEEAEALLRDIEAEVSRRLSEALEELPSSGDCLERVSEASGALSVAQAFGIPTDAGAGERLVEAVTACPLVGTIERNYRIVALDSGEIVEQWFRLDPPVIFHKPAGTLALRGTTHTRLQIRLRLLDGTQTSLSEGEVQQDNRVVGAIDPRTLDVEIQQIAVSNMDGAIDATISGPGLQDPMAIRFRVHETASTDAGSTATATVRGTTSFLSMGLSVEATTPHESMRLPLVPYHSYVEPRVTPGNHSEILIRVSIRDESDFTCDDHETCTIDRFLPETSTCSYQPATLSLDADPFDCELTRCVDGELRQDFDPSQVEQDRVGNCYSMRCDPEAREPFGAYDAGDPPRQPPPELVGFDCYCNDETEEMECAKGERVIVVDP